MKAIKILAIFVGLVTLPYAQAKDILQEGMPFDKARNVLFKKGWEPVRMHASKAAPDSEGFPVTGSEWRLFKKGVFEVDSCSMDAGTLCNFIYKRGETCMRLMTRGEIPKNMRVVQWDFTEPCPEANTNQVPKP